MIDNGIGKTIESGYRMDVPKDLTLLRARLMRYMLCVSSHR